MKVINAHADKTGKKVMYAFNISGEIDEMQERYEKIVNAGGTCAMISINSVGLFCHKKNMRPKAIGNSCTPQWLGHVDEASVIRNRF